jgi:hypothetical protein
MLPFRRFLSESHNNVSRFQILFILPMTDTTRTLPQEKALDNFDRNANRFGTSEKQQQATRGKREAQIVNPSPIPPAIAALAPLQNVNDRPPDANIRQIPTPSRPAHNNPAVSNALRLGRNQAFIPRPSRNRN